MTATPQKLLVRALKGERTERPPIWLMRQAGRYLPEYRKVREQAGGMLRLCLTPEHAAEVTLQPLRRFPLDGAILFADLPQIGHALGQHLEYREGDGPVLDPPIRSTADMARHLDATSFHDIMGPVYETVRRLSVALPAHVTLIGYAGAPWTVASYMVEGRGGAANEYANVKRWAFSDPGGFQSLIDLLVRVTSEFLIRQVAAGAEVLQLFDSWAGVLPEPFFRRWCEAPVAAIIANLRSACPDVPIIAFPRGAGLLYAGYAERTGAAAIGLDTTVPVGWAASDLQTNGRRNHPHPTGPRRRPLRLQPRPRHHATYPTRPRVGPGDTGARLEAGIRPGKISAKRRRGSPPLPSR
jgi:uroporphyrinogen decarboxylase